MLKCKQCQGLFKTNKTFDSHTCVKQYEEMSLEQLLALYNKQGK